MKKWNKVILLVFILSMLGHASFGGPEISKKTVVIINKIAKENTLRLEESAQVNKKLENNFTMLKEIAKKEELLELTEHQNKIVRCYAFWVLSYYDSVDLFSIIIRHIDDKEKIDVQLYDSIETGEKVGDFFIKVATSPESFFGTNKLTTDQKTRLDYLLIKTPNELSSRKTALMRIKPTPELYLIVRDLYLKNNDQAALVALAKYRKEQDIQLVLNNREKIEYSNHYLDEDPQSVREYEEQGYNYTYIAISYFPNEKFLPLLHDNLIKALDNSLWSDEWRNLYKAIASYKNNEALMLLQLPLTQVIKNEYIRETHLESINDALLIYKDPIYEELLWKLWIKENIINLEGFKYLFNRYPTKTLEVTKKWLNNPNKPWDSWKFEKLINEMLNLLLIKNKDLALEIIKTNIKEPDVLLFNVFADKITDIEDKSIFIESLFFRLNNESNPHVYLKIVKLLIAYHDNNINKSILDIRDKNKNLQSGWGGEALNNLLKDNK